MYCSPRVFGATLALLLLALVAATLHAATIAPTLIPLTSPEISNPGRGDYIWCVSWNGAPNLPPEQVFYDEYDRLPWNVLEPVKNQYDLEALETLLQQAKNRGRKYGFRIMCVSEYNGKNLMPAHLEAEGLGTRITSAQDLFNNIFVPYWNDERFLARVQALLTALGQRFNGDPRISYIDIGIYGHWGEWHMSGLGGWTPNRDTVATAATRRRLIDMVATAFPDTQLLLMPDTCGYYPEDSTTGFVYAMETYPTIGVRKDNLSHPWFEQEVGDWFPAIRDAFNGRWRTAPFVTEFYGGEDDAAMYRAEQQVKDYHVSQIATNVLHPTNRVPIGKAAGYRFQLNQATFPDTVVAGTAFTLSTVWSNVGVAPLYEPFTVTYELYSGATKIWSGPSSLNLKTFLPETNKAWSDALGLTPAVTPGTYTLKLAILDALPGSYRLPLALAIQGRGSDGRYTLGTLTVTAPSGNAIPSVSLSSPSDGATHSAGSTLTLSASASDPEGALTNLAFLVNDSLVAQSASSPFSTTWTPTVAGTYRIEARATDAAGNVVLTQPATIKVTLANNPAPSLTLITPIDGDTYYAPATINISATATDDTGVASVAFYYGSTLIATDTTAPYTATWSNVGAGTYTVIAKATDTLGKSSSVTSVITVAAAPRGPYGDTLKDVTSRIEFEDFDEGGEGQAYHDSTAPNEGGAYRGERVDLESCSDTSGTYNVAWGDAGEWLEYTLKVPQAGTYTLNLRMASPPNIAAGQLKLYVDGSLLSSFTLPQTGRWDWDFHNWTTASFSNLSLPVGQHTLRFEIVSGYYNLNWFQFVAQSTSGNHAPTANAGPDITVTDTDSDGYATVNLTATGSSDPDGTLASYTWKEGTTVLATGATATVSLTTGVHSITLLVTDNAGATAGDTLKATVSRTPYFQWARDNGLSDSNAAPTGDFDKDGLTNLAEFALGTDPRARTPSGSRPTASLASNQLALTFRRQRAELTYTVQQSTDLNTWTNVAANPGAVGQDTTVAVPASASPVFLRLNVSE